METKKYWQAKDKCGDVYLFHTRKPELSDDGDVWDNCGCCDEDITFPIPLKPLQIAEITVCENGTWSYEIEREEGYYMVRYPDKSSTVWRYESRVWYYGGSEKQIAFMPDKYTISQTRIPDECII